MTHAIRIAIRNAILGRVRLVGIGYGFTQFLLLVITRLESGGAAEAAEKGGGWGVGLGVVGGGGGG